MTSPSLRAAAAQELLERRRARDQFTAFKAKIYPSYLHAPHLEMIDSLLSQVEQYISTRGREGIGRVVIELPPRHGKTVTVSRLFPAWVIGRHPDSRLILVSYGSSLAEKNSRVVRNLIRNPIYRQLFPHVNLADDSQSVQAWDIQGREGGADAMGIGGGVTGKGAHLLVIDDPIKNREEAESLTFREKVWDSYTDDLFTRLEPGGAVVVMMTRWHEDDLIGRLLRHEVGTWTRLRLPAFAEKEDPLGREEGQALWPERYSESQLREIESTLGSYSFSALYQQNPQPSGGGLFKVENFQIVPYAPECVKTVRFWDLAVTKSSHSDYSVGVKLGITHDERVIVLDVVRFRAEFPDVQQRIIQTAKIDGPSTKILIEGEKAGIIALDTLSRLAEMRPYSINKRTPRGDKYSRALPLASRVEAGRVFLVQGSWNSEFISEFGGFPTAEHDDQVDGASGAYQELSVVESTVSTVQTSGLYASRSGAVGSRFQSVPKYRPRR